jgi:hypothetical protein
MSLVHVFISSGRFRNFAAMREFIDETYTEQGDGVPSAFMLEVGLEDYEPMCIEATHSPHAIPLTQLIGGASYASEWLHRLPGNLVADAAICVFEPNLLTRPHESSLTYLGAFEYRQAEST